MSGNNFVTKHLLRRRVSEHRPYEEDNDNDSSSSSSSSSDEDERSKKGSKGSKEKGKKDGKGKDKNKDKSDWVKAQDPYGRLCWQNRKTGQVTYGNNVAMPQQGYNPNLARQGFSEAPIAAGYPAHGAGPAAASAVPVGPPGYMVPPGPYMHSPVGVGGGYGHSPVAMYQQPPWNAAGAPPVPMAVQVPDYVKKQMNKEKKRKAEEERKKLEKTGTWQRHYGSDGSKFWQNTASGRKMPMDPYK